MNVFYTIEKIMTSWLILILLSFAPKCIIMEKTVFKEILERQKSSADFQIIGPLSNLFPAFLCAIGSKCHFPAFLICCLWWDARHNDSSVDMIARYFYWAFRVWIDGDMKYYKVVHCAVLETWGTEGAAMTVVEIRCHLVAIQRRCFCSAQTTQ